MSCPKCSRRYLPRTSLSPCRRAGSRSQRRSRWCLDKCCHLEASNCRCRRLLPSYRPRWHPRCSSRSCRPFRYPRWHSPPYRSLQCLRHLRARLRANPRCRHSIRRPRPSSCPQHSLPRGPRPNHQHRSFPERRLESRPRRWVRRHLHCRRCSRQRPSSLPQRSSPPLSSCLPPRRAARPPHPPRSHPRRMNQACPAWMCTSRTPHPAPALSTESTVSNRAS